MKIGAFLLEIEKNIRGDGNAQVTRAMVARVAQSVFDREHRPPDGVSVKLHCSGSGTKLLKLSVKLLPEHQDYCAWLKPRAQYVSSILAHFSYTGKGNELRMAPFGGVGADSGLDEIVVALESDIKRQTHAYIQKLRSLYTFSQEHRVSGDALYEFYALGTELQRCSSIGPRELFRTDTISSILADEADSGST